MSNPRKLIEELRELGPGVIMLTIGGALLMGVLTLYGQVYHESKGNAPLVHLVAGVASGVAVVLLVLGFIFLRRSVEGNLWEMGIIGRRYLKVGKLLKRIRKAKSITIIKTWFPENDEIEEALEAALEKRASVKLILCRPGSDILKTRCEGAGVKPREADEWIFKGLEMVRRLLAPKKKRKKFKGAALHVAWPGCPVVKADERTYMGFYFHGRTSPNSPWVRIRPESDLATYLQAQENLLWESAKKSGIVLKDWAALDKWLKKNSPSNEESE